MNKTQWIFFDVGGTLVNVEQAYRERIRLTLPILRRQGIRKSVDEIIALSIREAAAFARKPFWAMLKKLGLSENSLQVVLRQAPYSKRYEHLYPGAVEILSECSSRYRLGIIANQGVAVMDLLQMWGILQFFSIIIISATFGCSKPDPSLFRAAEIQSECAPEDILMVGDRLDNDIAPANKRGWNTLRVKQGFFRFQEPRHTCEAPDYVLPSVDRLLDCDISSFFLVFERAGGES